MQRTQCGVQAFAVIAGALEYRPRHPRFVRRHAAAESGRALAPRTHALERFGDVEKFAEAAFDQMPAGRLHRRRVVERDEIGVHARMASVHQHRRLAVQRFGIGETDPAAQRVEDEAVDLVARERIDGLALTVDVVAEVEQHHEVAGILTGFLRAAQHGHRIGIGDVGHDQADEARSAVAQGLRHRARRVVELGNGGFDARRDVRAQQALAMVEEARDGGLGYTRRLGDVGDGRAGRALHGCPRVQAEAVS